MHTVYYLILVPMVYVAFAVFFIGTGVRLYKIFREPKNPSTLQVYPERRPKWLRALYDAFLLPTVRRQYPVFWGFLMAFHIAFLLIIIGHAELFTAFSVFRLEPEHVFVGRGFAGLTICIALVYFLLRRFKSPFRELSVPEDYYLLILLFLTAVFGSEMDWARRWFEYGSMTVSTYREYLVRAGYNYAKNPVNEHNNFNGAGAALTDVQGIPFPTYYYETFRIIGFPAMVEQHLTLGVGYEFSDRLSLNVGYVHGFEKTIKETGLNPLGEQTTLKSTLSEDSVDFGLTWRF